MIAWIKKLRYLVANAEYVIANLRGRIEALEADGHELRDVLKDRTTIGVDVGFRSASHVIVIGKYRNVDYVQTFEMDTPNLEGLINQLKERERYGTVRHVDAMPTIRAVFKNDWRHL